MSFSLKHHLSPWFIEEEKKKKSGMLSFHSFEDGDDHDALCFLFLDLVLMFFWSKLMS